MGLFKKKEPDMKCRNCDQLISHKKVKWKKRMVDYNKLGHTKEQKEATENLMKELTKSKDMEKYKKPVEATPNEIFGQLEYEYRGECPKCKGHLNCFWFGEDSAMKIDGLTILPKRKPFVCTECESVINREFQVWYSVMTVIEEDKTKEWLVTICPSCKEENGYPFEYNLGTGKIE